MTGNHLKEKIRVIPKSGQIRGSDNGGFKQTEVGLIPMDWEVKLLPEVVDYVHGKAHEPFVDPHGDYVVVNSKFVSSEGLERKFCSLNLLSAKKGDVLTVLSDLPNGKALAKCYLVEEDDKYAVNQRVCIWRTKGMDSSYLFYLLNRNKYFLRLNDGVSQTHILNYHIEKCPLQAPPTLTEQTAIATALSDMDALVTAQEKLIAKKRAIKQGAMQELLKPKEGWEERPLNDIVNYIHGKAHEQYIDKHGEYVVVNSKFISSDGQVVKFSSHNFCPAKKDDVLTVLSDLPNGKALAKCFLVPTEKKYAVNQRVCIWRSKKADPKFLFYILNRNSYFLALDDGISQTHILNHHIEKCRISIPVENKEQTRIAGILSDMDTEIEQLEAQLAKYRQVKVGMMQELLTGKKRLV